jgi:hypothetical protein
MALPRDSAPSYWRNLVGRNDKDAALAAGYSLSVAQNTKPRIWNPRVRAEWDRLRCQAAARIVQHVQASKGEEGPRYRESLGMIKESSC